MHDVTYKNVLENKKHQTDFIRWAKVHWPEEQRWGTTAVKLCTSWESGSRVVVCRYTMKESDQTAMGSMSPEFGRLIKSLESVTHVRRTALRIGPLLRKVFRRSRSRRRKRRFQTENDYL